MKLQGKIKHAQQKYKNLIIKGLLYSKKITFPGLQGQSLYEVGGMFWKGLAKGYITERAAAVAFNFLTALFPLLLFAFTVIPYIPLAGFQANLLDLLKTFIPEQVWQVIDPTITYIVTQKKGSLLSIGGLLSLYFATNGINSLITSFSHSYYKFSTYNFLRRRINSLIILLVVGMMLAVVVMLIMFGNSVLGMIRISGVMSQVLYYGLYLFRLSLVVFMALLIISFLYRMAITDRQAFPLFSVGAKIAAFLIIITTFAFSFYITNWTRYNMLYGSLGTILVLTMYIYLNAIFLLIGFDINISIYAAKRKNEKR
ncbi:MAG: YihY/virulence factor BrkB family protein [Prevotellaceae bacterium]|jgi:membrane protein|nr:YihY/virulence factor BrkB family protein [Prevotellaceae bacterium]